MTSLQLPDVVLIKDEDSDSNDSFEEGQCSTSGSGPTVGSQDTSLLARPIRYMQAHSLHSR